MLPIKKILIANRGEVVSRIARTCKKMGLICVGVYSEADAEMPYLKDVDEIIFIGASTATQSYLDIEKLVSVAVKSGCDAVHPGWGFLSERAEFAEAVVRAGLVWVGPSAESIRSLGDKERARGVASGIAPIVEGAAGRGRSSEELKQEAIRIGWPILLKAAAGGGGRGQRVVWREEEWEERMEEAQREAEASFGDGAVLVERYVERGRHVEVQIVGDGSGDVVSVSDRECSVQRRRQKVLEECPAWWMSDEQRGEMHRQARELCCRVRYCTTGTVEFLVDMRTGKHYFLEVNTRLQVEHTVTEQVMGLDLVQLQLLTACGTRLKQLRGSSALPLWDDGALVRRAHAIQLRVCTEDGEKDYAPSAGKLHLVKWPEGENIRVEKGVQSGSRVSTFYDSMVGKIIVTAPDRSLCIALADRAASSTLLVGECANNLSALLTVLRHPDFKNSSHYTTWLQTLPSPPPSFLAPSLAHAALAAHSASSGHRAGAFRNARPAVAAPWPGRLMLRHNTNVTRIEWTAPVAGSAPGSSPNLVRVDGGEPFAVNVQLIEHSGDVRSAWVRQGDGAAIRVDSMMWREGEVEWVAAWSTQGGCWRWKKAPRGDWERKADDEEGEDGEQQDAYVCSMPATILKIAFANGASVTKGQTVLVMESMKMEMKISAHRDGNVHYLVKQGDVVKEGTRLLEIK